MDPRDTLAAILSGSLQNQATPPGPWPGMISGPNIDLAHRPLVRMPGGGTGTVYSRTFDQRQGPGAPSVLLPGIADGQVLSSPQSWQRYQDTGENLGVFTNRDYADAYAQALHEAQARFYGLQ